MATETENYGYPKPDVDDFYDVGDFNQAMDMIDGDIKGIEESLSSAIDTKVDKISGKGLSTNDYTTAEKIKLAGVAANANNYSLPAASASARGGVKTGYAQTGKNYPVQLSNEQMYVNVPWTDTQKITGVKGNAESSYRTGNVNITAANIGAVSTEYLNEHFVPDHISSFKGSAGSKGWHRIAKAVGTHGGNSCVISMKRGYNTPSPEYQKVQLINAYDTQRFSPLAAASQTHMWTKIRCTRDSANSTTYIELYQDRDNSINTWLITIEDAQGVYANHWKAMTPTLTSEMISGVSVLASMDLPSWFDSRVVTDDGDGKNISFSYQKSGLTSSSWLAAWNNYELRSIAPGNITGVGSAVKATNDGSGNNIVNTYAKKSIYDDSAISMGRKSGTTVGEKSSAIGSVVEASGKCSHAEGYLTTASGKYSHAEGSDTTASREDAHAEGYYTNASGIASHAEGSSTNASEDYSHAEGSNTNAIGSASHAEGSNTKAIGSASHAEGSNTNAIGNYSHAEGYETKASNFASHVSGKYSKAMTEGGDMGTQVGDVFVIGNGTSASTARSNALRVTYKGDIY